MAVSVIAVEGLPEITEGDDLAAMVVQSAAASGEPVASGDIVIVTSKIVSKSEGRTVDLDTVDPLPLRPSSSRSVGRRSQASSSSSCRSRSASSARSAPC